MENAYVWAHEICGELQISKISCGSQKWAEFLNEIVLGFSRSIGADRFRKKKSDFASVLLYTFSGLPFLRVGPIFRVPFGRRVPPSGRPCVADALSAALRRLALWASAPQGPPCRFAPGRPRPYLILLSSPCPLCVPPSLSFSFSPSPFFLFPNPDERGNEER